MNSHSPASSVSPGLRGDRRGFTIVELLVVIGIIALLAGLTLTVLSRVTKSAGASKLAADLNAIGIALEAYKQDFGDYPRPARLPPASSSVITVRPADDAGSIILTWGLMGPYPATATGGLPFDGADGLGFRVRAGSPPSGKVHGPYLAPDRFRLGTQGSFQVLLDGYSNPILYFPAKPGAVPDLTTPAPHPTNPNNYVSPESNSPQPRMALFDPSYSTRVTQAQLLAVVQKTQFKGPFVLWSAGVDQGFNTADDVTNVSK